VLVHCVAPRREHGLGQRPGAVGLEREQRLVDRHQRDARIGHGLAGGVAHRDFHRHLRARPRIRGRGTHTDDSVQASGRTGTLARCVLASGSSLPAPCSGYT
jgi:hypothetical protein